MEFMQVLNAIIFAGMLWMEIKQVYNAGMRVYLLDYYNIIDFTVLSLYLASYALRFFVDQKLREVDAVHNATAKAREALADCNVTYLDEIRRDLLNKSYFLKACK